MFLRKFFMSPRSADVIPRRQRRSGVIVQDGDGALQDDRTGIEIARHEMDRHPADLDALAPAWIGNDRESTKNEMAGWTGLEPATSDVTGRRSNQLNYDSAKNCSFW